MKTTNLHNYDAAYAPSSCYQILNMFEIRTLFKLTHLTKTKTKLRGLSLHANYTDRAAAACNLPEKKNIKAWRNAEKYFKNIPMVT